MMFDRDEMKISWDKIDQFYQGVSLPWMMSVQVLHDKNWFSIPAQKARVK